MARNLASQSRSTRACSEENPSRGALSLVSAGGLAKATRYVEVRASRRITERRTSFLLKKKQKHSKSRRAKIGCTFLLTLLQIPTPMIAKDLLHSAAKVALSRAVNGTPEGVPLQRFHFANGKAFLTLLPLLLC